MQSPEHGDDWLGLHDGPLPVAAVHEWVIRPDCGAVVLFSGTVRDHADGRPGVEHLTYEAYAEQVVPRLAAVTAEIRQRWTRIRRIALLHRIGQLEVGESSVVTAVSAPHRPEAFAAGQFAIDAVKASVPIWKHEVWDGGEDWSSAATGVTDASAVPSSERA